MYLSCYKTECGVYCKERMKGKGEGKKGEENIQGDKELCSKHRLGLNQCHLVFAISMMQIKLPT